jgi:hypothetical protein
MEHMELSPKKPAKPKTSPLMALLLGFSPAAILMAAFSGLGLNLPAHQQNVFLWSACIISIVCCFISSALLFRRGTGVAIAGAFLLMFVNGFIAFFFGCLASLKF